MNKNKKKGFTLTELIVVLVIMAIIAAIAVPFFINYWKKAEFRKNEENAKTVYLAAESRLTYYRSSGQWDAFKKEIRQAVKDGNDAKAEKAVFKDGKNSSLNDRIYTIKLNKDAKDQTKKNNLLLRLLDDYTYDKGFFDASISVEIDMESGEVYSAFYGSRCKGLNYKDADADGYLTMQKRDYDSRSERLLGYYSTEDTVNTVNLETKRLRITTINLVNSEKLSLEWSSNVGSDLGVDYKVAFYQNDNSGNNPSNNDQNDDKTPLFTLRVSPYDMGQQGWSGMTDSNTGMMATLELTKANGTKEETGWQFPVTYSDNKYSVVLDGMMSAKVQATLKSQTNEEIRKSLEKSSSISITRLAAVANALAEPQNIYATVQATAYTGSAKVNVNQEYRNSEAVASNVANTMFGNNTKNNNIEVTAFRHLSNMRYYEENHEENHKGTTTFTLANKNMDWASVGTGVYDFHTEKQADGSSVEKLAWQENTKDKTVGFPTIGELPASYTVKGNGNQTLVSNLHLNEESVADDATADKLGISKSEFLGLFAELKGTVQNVTFQTPTLEIGSDGQDNSDGKVQYLKGIGVLAGRSEGNLKNIAITAAKSNTQSEDVKNVKVDASDNRSEELGVGGLIGVLAGYDDKHEFTTLSSGTVSELSVEGNVEAAVPVTGTLAESARGIGGIIGYAKLDNTGNSVKIQDSENHADVSGNLSTGGIVGRLDGNFNYNNETSYLAGTMKKRANIENCSSDGLILCTSEDKDSGTIEGNYFGGIAGYSDKALIYNSTSASGRAGNFRYSNYVDQKDTLLLGNYVGGITGYGSDTLLANCSTEKNGYVLGNEYVGGIAGGLGGSDVKEAIQAAGDSAVSATTNASYVIGNSYVGGIIGVGESANADSENVALKNCINNGVAAGYQNYVGGIVGYNQKGSTIEDCASYLSDYDSSIYNMIVNEWEAKASYAGGIAGYNDGAIKFSAASQAITVKSVSSIVVGENYVGGIAGFNDADATIDVHYTLIGGRIFAYGKCAGGAFGLNASESVLNSELTIRPQSIQGNYYVGGVIGANVVNLSKDITMEKISTNNALGRITGNAFCGGIIGYQRTYTPSQLGTAALSKKALDLLPEPGKNSGVPTTVERSKNAHQLTVKATNNIPIRAGLYAGGIIGYCEKDSKLLIKDSTNRGDIALTSAVTSSSWKDGVVLSSYIESNEIGKTGLPAATNNVKMHFAGGIISVNLENQIVDNCANTGNMSGYTGSGGVVGLNAGLVYDCSLNQHFGSAALNYIGGIAGINVGTSGEKTYNRSDSGAVKYTAGTIQNCTTAQNKTVSGSANVGGLVGWNLNDGVLKGNTSNANISASGRANVGGIAGRNNGQILVAGDSANNTKYISAGNATGVGGLVGTNESNGTITVTGNGGTNGEIVAVNSGVSVNGSEKVGGIVGINHGVIGETGTTARYLTCKARSVRASHGYAGGIVGETNGNIVRAVNRSTTVTADEGLAGGITAVNNEGKTIRDCTNYGNVRSSKGYASGIAAKNSGTIAECTVKGAANQKTEINSLGENEMGAVTAVNNGVISNSKPDGNVVLNGDAVIFGGVTGVNAGMVSDSSEFKITEIPVLRTTKGNLVVGGVVGQNYADGEVNTVEVNTQKASDTSTLVDFTNYRYLGGVVGENRGTVTAAKFSGTIKEKTGVAGDCYGGIAGINEGGGMLKDCEVGQITLNVTGVYAAASTSTAAEKEAMSTHVGGVVGKNEENATIDGCSLENKKESKLTAEYGMLGGVTGFNKGIIKMSGSTVAKDIMTEDPADAATYSMDTLADKLAAKAQEKGLKKDDTWVTWKDSAQVEDLQYRGTGTATSGGTSKKVSDDRLQMIMSSNGNIGGITAFNGTTGALTECVSGNWFLVNKSEAPGVGTGGIIGMNESEKDLSKLINGAFVGRQLSSTQTNRFAGGIIGNQNNSTSRDWTIDMCINFGTIYCYNSHYSGGIIGQWTGSGGNITNSQNYGNLQTTCKVGWFGASAGIVAQLYHADEDNEYNIISCGNFGSIYGRAGSYSNKWAIDNCANDSAGILGNITAYQYEMDDETKENKSQGYSIQVIDCVNGPGVEIYSASMSSGVVGFFSADGAEKKGTEDAANLIKNSTANIKLRIERCQNYATMLSGRNYAGGILGDKYGETGCDNTVVNNCYSVNLNYSDSNNPIFSMQGRYGNGSTDYIREKKNNYFIQYLSNSKISFSNVTLTHEKDSRAGAGNASNNLTASGLKGSGDLQEWQYAQYEFMMFDADQNKYCVTTINPSTTINGADVYIDGTGRYIRTKDTNNLVGQVLYYLDESWTSDIQKVNMNAIIGSGSNYYKYARESYRRIEGVENGKLLAPKKAEATVKDGKISVKITPEDLPGSATGEKCDPFKYKVHITDENGKSADVVLYGESESFDIPAGLSGDFAITITASSMYSDILDSDSCKTEVEQVAKVLPEPDVRAEMILIPYKDTKDYRYQFSLNNLEDYADYPGWQVEISLRGRDETVILNEDQPTNYLDINLESKRNKKDNTYQMNAQAMPRGTAKYEKSAIVSTSVYLPYFQAFMGFKAQSGKNTCTNIATPSATITGNTLDSLSVNIKIDNTNSDELLEVTPIYRAELIGNWKDSDETVVFAKTDIMTVSKGVATANFTSLPEYLKDAKNLKVRLWYAQTGLGPVYLYHDMASEDDGSVSSTMNLKKGRIKELAGVEDGKETWKYAFSLSVHNEWGDFDPYLYTSNTLFTWLPAPTLDQKDGTTLEPDIDETTGKLRYHFSWDKDVNNGQYQISLTGIDDSGRSVVIDTSDYSGGNSYTADADEWNYKQVKLKVTRLGDENKGEVGLSTEATYNVKKRLEQPTQPTVELASENELIYNLSWLPITSEDGCAGYQAYVREYEGDELGAETAVGDLITTDEIENGTYEEQVDLEKYADKRIVIYLKAKASADSAYLDSVAGITYELEVPRRLKKPTVEWNINWTYGTDKYIMAEKFENGGLTVGLQAQNDQSVPPGGSAYLLKAYVFDSKADADAAQDSASSSPAKAVQAYPVDGTVAQMDAKTTHDYTHSMQNLSIKYAGKWIVFYARISSGAGNISSEWTKSESYRLPYVKLQSPQVTSTEVEDKLTASVTETPEVPGTDQEWTATRTVLNWNSVDCSDIFRLSLSGSIADSSAENGKKAQNTDLRILQTDEGIRLLVHRQVEVEVEKTDATGKIYKEKEMQWKWIAIEENDLTDKYPEGTPETEIHHVFDIPDYSVTIESTYAAANGGTPAYKLTLSTQLDVVKNEDGTYSYVLKLPDVSNVKAADESTVTHNNFAITDQAVFHANVTENVDEDRITQNSKAYIESDETKIEWKK